MSTLRLNLVFGSSNRRSWPAGRSFPANRLRGQTLIAILRAPEGATIEEIMAATGWQAHSARGLMSGALKKQLGLTITSEKVDGRGRAYHLAEGRRCAGDDAWRPIWRCSRVSSSPGAMVRAILPRSADYEPPLCS